MRYVQLKSVTWWTGIGCIGLGGAGMFVPANDQITALGGILSAMLGASTSSPAALIGLGAGLIGIRDKLERIGNQ